MSWGWGFLNLSLPPHHSGEHTASLLLPFLSYTSSCPEALCAATPVHRQGLVFTTAVLEPNGRGLYRQSGPPTRPGGRGRGCR